MCDSEWELWPSTLNNAANLTELIYMVACSLEQDKTTREWELVDVADSSQLGTPDRIAAKREGIHAEV